MEFASRQDRQALDNYTQAHHVRDENQTEALFGETVRAGFNMVMLEERTDSSRRAYTPHYDERAEKIMALGGDPILAKMYSTFGPSRVSQLSRIIDSDGEITARLNAGDAEQQLIDAILQVRSFTEQFPGEVLTDQQIAQTVSAELAEKRKANEAILARGGGGAAFLGQAAALATDPLLIPTYALGAGSIVGRGVVGNAVRAFGVEAGIAFGSEIPIQADVYQFKKEIDSPWTFADSAFNVLAATVGAGTLRATGSITIDTVGPLIKKYRGLPASRRTPEADAAADTLERATAHQAENPLDFDTTHQDATTKARAQAEAGETVDVSDVVKGTEPLNEVDRVTELGLDDVATLEPGEILVDARRFQFKEGGDAAGVTSALEGVTRFDRSLAGQILVWEDSAGKVFVVDGHQRVGLANRALASGQDPAEVRLSGFVLRETDGVTALDAMRIGAVRNLSATTGSALDAAKVLRGIGPAGEGMLPPLPPNSAMLRQGRFIARLGDDAFNAVVNEVVPARQAAVVGELITGDAEQVATIDALARLKPANEVQARAMVEQIRVAGFKKQTTGDLFGEREIAETLIRERAQVIDAAMRQARQDKTTFSRLVSRGTDIEDVGANKLDSRANRQRLEESGQAIETISRLANTKGPISDAIGKAAQEVADGAKPADTIGPILEAIGRTADGGDTGRGAPRGAGREPAAELADNMPGSGEVGPGTQGFQFDENPRMTPAEAEVEQRFKDLLESTPWEELKAKYATLSEAHGGKTLSVDAARELSPDYLADRTLSNAVHEPASAFIKRLWTERLAEAPAAGEKPWVMFTAGGTGAGKTTGLEVLGEADRAQMIFDTNLAKFGSGVKKIDQALEAGKNVTIMYVYRDPLESLVNGAFKRAARQAEEFGTGRTVPLQTHVSTHVGSNQVVRQLADHYADDPRVVVAIIDNSNGKGNTARSTLEALPELDRADLEAKASQALEEAVQNGQITEEIAAGFRGAPAGQREGGPGVRGQSEPARGAGSADLLGDDTRAAQAIADETARRDAARSAGQESLETGDPTDLFSQARQQSDLFSAPTSPGKGVPNEGAATGFVPDSEYDTVMAQYRALDEELGDMAQIARQQADEFGAIEVDVVSARQVMQELDNTERAINDIEACLA